MENQIEQLPPLNLTWSERSFEIKDLAAALSKAQAVIENAAKDKENPFFKSQYADLASVWGVARKPLSDNGLSVLQEPSSTDGKVSVTTTLMHSSGQYIRSVFEVPVGRQDAQGYGSAVTYLRRYALQSFIGIAPAEDDGNGASEPKSKPKAAPQTDKKALPTSTPRPADTLPPKAKVETVWDGSQMVHGGKYKGKKWSELPADYLEWARHNAKQKDTQKMAEWEISRREELGQPDFQAINEEAESINDENPTGIADYNAGEFYK